MFSTCYSNSNGLQTLSADHPDNVNMCQTVKTETTMGGCTAQKIENEYVAASSDIVVGIDWNYVLIQLYNCP